MMFRNQKLQRTVAALVLTTFTSLTLSPLVAAAQTAAASSASSTWTPLQQPSGSGNDNTVLLPIDPRGLPKGKGQSNESKGKSGKTQQVSKTAAYEQALARLHDLADQADAGANASARIAAIRTQYAIVRKQESQAIAAFAATEAHLKSQGLPAEILQRHQAAVADYKARTDELKKAMANLDNAAQGKVDAQSALADIKQLVTKYPSRNDKKPNKGATLPWGRNKAVPHQVATTARQHERLFPRSIQVAAAGSLSGITLPDAILPVTPQPEDLAASEDVQITPEIRALAAQLNNNPVDIYNWVRNNIQYAPGYGAMQGAAATLQSKRGNAFDTASALIALYRAANIPARYAYGTIEVPVARLQNWLGVDNVAAAQSLLTQAGIPNKAVAQGGQTNAVQLEHAWVEAFVDYAPSRGAINLQPQAWVPLDPSFKLVQSKPGLDLHNAIAFNETALLDAVKLGATCSVDAAVNLNATNLQTGLDNYKKQLNSALAQRGTDLTTGDVLGSRVIDAKSYSILLGTLPYTTVVKGAVFNTLPDPLRWKLRFQVFADSTAQGQGQSTAALSASFAALAGKRITLSFAPATQADADTLASYMPHAHADGSPIQPSEFPADIPGYLIRVKAELRVDGQVVASGGSFVLGSELLASTGVFDAVSGAWNDTTATLHAGDYQALALDAQGIDAGQLQTVKARLAAAQSRLANGQGGSLNRDDVAGDMLYETALAYFATADADGAIFQRAAGTIEQRLPSWGRAVAPATPHMVLGIVGSVSFPGVVLDIDRMSSAVAAQSGGLDASAYVRQSNERNAAYAHLVLQKLYTSAQQPGEAASAVKVLALNALQNQTVYAVTSANAATTLPLINLSASAKADVQNAVAAGYRVLIAQNPSTVGAWSGQAMQIEDLATGSGAYRLLGDDGSHATAALYLPGGMGWLAMAQPFQAAAVAPSMQNGQDSNTVLASMLDGSGNTIRWSYFAGQADVANGLFLARLASAENTQACDSTIGAMAANAGTATGLDQTGSQVAAMPYFTSAPVTAATAGQAYRYAATVVDPQGLSLTYRLQDAPTGMTISPTGLVYWDKPIAGSFSVTVVADNSKAYAEQRYLLSVGNEALPLDINLSVAPAIINQGETVKITVVTNGGTGNISKTLTVDGQPVALDASGQAGITGTTMGAHRILVIATDSLGTINKSSLYSVRNPADTTAPTAAITSPADDAEVTAPVDVVGTASDANLAYYQLLLRPAGTNAWQEIARGYSAVINGALGKLDPTQLANGIYELALNVVDANGQQTSQLVTLDIYRDLKIGQFAISFEDLNVDAAGIPIRVTRTYDTRRKGESLDFGYGWSVDYQSVQLRKNMVLGLQWEVTAKQLLLCLAPVGKRKINITLPNGHVERFTAANAQECAFGTVPDVNVQLNPLPGTTSKLEVDNVPGLLAQGGVLYDADNFEPWNPKDFKLTTEDNYVYYITEGIGITRVQDPTGNTLTYGRNGILHSNGQSVAFTRDAAGRITAITDPAGKQIVYAYSASGDLTSVTNRTQAVSKFNYNRSHGLVDYTDPQGTLAARYVYDADGRLIAAYDATGRAVEMTHDTANNREVVKDRRGNVTTYTYDAAGNVVEKIDALNRKTTYTYDALGNETATTDALGKTTKRLFDAQSGKQLAETDPLNHTVSWAYDQATKTQLQSTTDANANVTNYGYFGNGSRSIVEPLGRTTWLRLDANGNLGELKIADQSTTYTYDAKGNKLTETDAAGNVTRYSYDANNREIGRSWTRTVLVNGTPQQQTVSTTRKRDAEGRVLEETDALGHTTKTEYNAGGQVTATTDAQGRQTTYAYDAAGRLAKLTYPDGSTETYEYDAEGNKTAMTDRAGRTTRYEYDALNRLVKTTFPDGSSTGAEYDEVGRIAATIDAHNQKTVHQYDDAGRLEKIVTPDGKVTRFGYDANGNRTSVTDANGKTTKYAYDALNRLVKTTLPSGKSASIVWNANGTKQSETDPNGNVTQYGYDPVGRLSQVTQTVVATNQVTSYGYDNLGNKIRQTDAEGRITKWEYDAANRVTARILPGGQRETFAYDATGNLSTKTDFNGKTTSYSVDVLGRITGEVRPDGTAITTTYTASGQLASVTVSGGVGVQNGKTSYQYDANDRLIKQTNPDGTFLAYGYDANGNIVERSTPAGTVKYGYDDNQRLAGVTDIDGKTTTYHYEATGKLDKVILPNGVTATYRYDDNGRLLQIVHTKADSSIVTGVRYTVADNGQRTRVEEFDSQSTISSDVLNNPSRTSDYGYDGAGRLTSEKITLRDQTVRTIDYVYDQVGNRIKKTEATAAGTETTTYAYDSNDRLTTETKTTSTGSQVQTSYAWEANGNLKSKTVGSTGTYYVWNADNRLVEVKQGTSEATAQTVAKYSYDVNGSRVAKTEPGANGQADKMTSYLVDGTFAYANVVQESVTQGGNTESTRYVWGAGLIAQGKGNQASYYHADGLNSVKALTDAAGSTTDTYAYDAFGALANKTGAAGNAYRYTGEYFDEAIGLQYNRARWYDANVGRFVSMDLARGKQRTPLSLNKYLYADGNPTNKRDPSGLMSTGEFGAAMATIMLLSAIAIPNLSSQLSKFFSQLIGTLGTSSIGSMSTTKSMTIGKEQARKDQQALVASQAKAKERAGAILFHYTSYGNARLIQAEQKMYCGAGYKGLLRGEITYPSGAYATDIQPWDANFKQSDLANLFYGGNLNKDLTWWVAIDGLEFYPLYGAPHQYIRPCMEGDFIDVDAFMIGPNLMDP